MAFADAVQSLRTIELSDLTFENIGSWPIAVKVIVWVIVLCACLFAGYKYHVVNLEAQLEKSEKREQDLRKEFEKKAFEAANLDAYRQQMVEMEKTFGQLVSQLPSETEVPGLLEDITEKGLDAGLDFESIALQKEKSAEFYVELPISINVSGGYHDLGGFVSGIAALPRIVTLHDFSVKPTGVSGNLKMSILAKTYRYKKGDEQ
jgi:type IV pilus assembly protein PilO